MERSNANWINLATEEQILQPGERFDLKYVINPKGDGLSGSYWSVIFVEVSNPIDTANVSKGVSVNTKIRYAIQVITHFNAEAPVNITFDSIQVYKKDDMDVLEVQLKNESVVMVKPELMLQLYTMDGVLIDEIEVHTKKIYPYGCRKFIVDLTGVEAANYEGVLIADCKDQGLFGLNLAINL